MSDLERGINRTARKTTAVQLAAALGLADPVSVVFVEAARGRAPASSVLTALGTGGQKPGRVSPRLWNIPARNLTFTGRDDLLAGVREQLLAGHATVVQALHGMGGVGKTQLAAEYAHRCAESYELAWWIDAEQGASTNQATGGGVRQSAPRLRTPLSRRRLDLGLDSIEDLGEFGEPPSRFQRGAGETCALAGVPYKYALQQGERKTCRLLRFK